jgi:hypothetical protein
MGRAAQFACGPQIEQNEKGRMKNYLYMVGGIGAMALLMLWKLKLGDVKPQPVEELAHRLQDAWADHHTVA